MKKQSRAAMIALAVATLGSIGGMSVQPAYAARTAPLVNIENEPLPPNATMSQVEQGVLLALSSRGWTIQNKAPGKVDAQYARSNFTASITVTYTKSSFSVAYKDSTGLDYDQAKNKIHVNYNKWITNLKLDIPRYVTNLANGAPAQ